MLQPEADVAAVQERLGKVMGIAHFELVLAAELTIDAIQDAALELVKDQQFKTLKVETKRANKRFPLTSPEVSAAVGAHLLRATGTSADMHTPDLRCNIEIVRRSSIHPHLCGKTSRGWRAASGCEREGPRYALWWD